MDPIVKLRLSIDALFGQGVSKHLPKNIEIFFSKRTGRIREVYHKQKLLCTLRLTADWPFHRILRKFL